MKKTSWIADFKAFITRGNVLDMSIGVVIGAAFTAIVTAVTDSIIKPIITLISGNTDFSAVTVGIFPIGLLISAVLNFLITAFVVFWMARIAHKLIDRKKKEEAAAPPAPPAPSKEELLLTEIRDILKERK